MTGGIQALWAIVVAGGRGRRFNGGTQSKLLTLLEGQTVLARSLQAIAQTPGLAGVVLVYHPDWLGAYQEALQSFQWPIPIQWVVGGPTRRDSVRHGLQALPPEADVVLIHDAARPLVQPCFIEAALIPIRSGDAIGTSLGLPVQNTLKQVAPGAVPWVTGTVNRETLWQVHTPQVFRVDILRAAHDHVPPDAAVNDDAELVEHYRPSSAVQMIPDDPGNIKITTPADVRFAEAWLRTQASPIPVYRV